MPSKRGEQKQQVPLHKDVGSMETQAPPLRAESALFGRVLYAHTERGVATKHGGQETGGNSYQVMWSTRPSTKHKVSFRNFSTLGSLTAGA